MKRARLLLALQLVFAWAIFPSVVSGAPAVLVYYRPWFVAKPFSSQWGWHWTMDRFDPDHVDAAGQRQIASWYHPLIGPYDSGDPAVLEYHALLMKLSGIDAVVVDWHGPDEFLDYADNTAHSRALFKALRKVGLKFALCYEDQNIQRQIQDNHLPPDKAIARAKAALLYAQTNFFNQPGYLRRDGQPVLLDFGPQFFKDGAQWQAIFSPLASSNEPAFFTEDYRLPPAIGAFNWPPMWLAVAPGARGVLSITALQTYFDSFEERARTWPAFISSAFPRFHDIYKSAGVRNNLGYLGDRKGKTFRETLTRAFQNGSAYVQIVSWNDFGEGTMVEPTAEYGFRDLGIIQEERREHVEPGFAFRPGDLQLPLRLYKLRKGPLHGLDFDAQLNAISDRLAAGRVADAEPLISAAEALGSAKSPPKP